MSFIFIRTDVECVIRLDVNYLFSRPLFYHADLRMCNRFNVNAYFTLGKFIMHIYFSADPRMFIRLNVNHACVSARVCMPLFFFSSLCQRYFCGDPTSSQNADALFSCSVSFNLSLFIIQKQQKTCK